MLTHEVLVFFNYLEHSKGCEYQRELMYLFIERPTGKSLTESVHRYPFIACVPTNNISKTC